MTTDRPNEAIGGSVASLSLSLSVHRQSDYDYDNDYDNDNDNDCAASGHLWRERRTSHIASKARLTSARG